MMLKRRDIDMFLDFRKYVWQEIKINNFLGGKMTLLPELMAPQISHMVRIHFKRELLLMRILLQKFLRLGLGDFIII